MAMCEKPVDVRFRGNRRHLSAFFFWAPRISNRFRLSVGGVEILLRLAAVNPNLEGAAFVPNFWMASVASKAIRVVLRFDQKHATAAA